MKLSELDKGQRAVILKVKGHGGFRKRILEMGFVRGVEVTNVMNAPLKDPIVYSVMGYNISLRRAEAEMVQVITEDEAKDLLERMKDEGVTAEDTNDTVQGVIEGRKKHINVALVGNPNCGKSSIFNQISDRKAHVGNYSGVTVGATRGKFRYRDYEFHITDLPGTYALTAYSPEERYVREYLTQKSPDVILDVICSSNLERNLYLTTELIDMSQKMVVALNMYDEFEASGDKLDYVQLGNMLGVPMVPVVGKTGQGLDQLLDTVISVYENRNQSVRHIHISQGVLEESVESVNSVLRESRDELPKLFPPRYYALKLLEGDSGVSELLKDCPSLPRWQKRVQQERRHIRYDLGESEDIETVVANQKYGFISGALRETLTLSEKKQIDKSVLIDMVVTHRLWGYPIFLAIVFLMFWCTFYLGKYPQMAIEWGVGWLGELLREVIPAGMLRDLISDGIVGGVGSVIVFLPNIMILYLFISFMEDSGYLARTAFIMDKVMHTMGLHGKSFIPLIMGFGCNVPAVMACRTIESRSSRLLTCLIIPFMSCSARLPLYILLTGTFFSRWAGVMMAAIYCLGICIAFLTSHLTRRLLLKADETPFVMELPPYRMPTLYATVTHMWERCAQYLKKMGGLILIASVIIWALSYFPLSEDDTAGQAHFEKSYIGQLGKATEPVFTPLGLNWKSAVSIISGIPAKEILVSTMGVLYSTESEDQSMPLGTRLDQSGDFNEASALALLVFVLLYFPCIATIAAIWREQGWSWAIGVVIYNTVLAWLVAFAAYHAVLLFI